MTAKTYRAFRSKWGRAVYNACFYSGLPESATESPWLVVTANGAIFGSGESASFGQSAIAYLDGRRLAYVKMRGKADLDLSALTLPGIPQKALETGKSVLYWFPGLKTEAPQ